jgi:hypothetical protein
MQGKDRLQTLRSKGSSAVEFELRQLEYFQPDVCGLTEEPPVNRARFVRGFLIWMFDSGRIDTSKITSKMLFKLLMKRKRI